MVFHPPQGAVKATARKPGSWKMSEKKYRTPIAFEKCELIGEI
jgi:hypothetical protein